MIEPASVDMAASVEQALVVVTAPEVGKAPEVVLELVGDVVENTKELVTDTVVWVDFNKGD